MRRGAAELAAELLTCAVLIALLESMRIRALSRGRRGQRERWRVEGGTPLAIARTGIAVHHAAGKRSAFGAESRVDLAAAAGPRWSAAQGEPVGLHRATVYARIRRQ